VQPFIPLSEIADISDSGIQDTEHLYGSISHRTWHEYHIAEDKFRTDKNTVAAIAEFPWTAERGSESGYLVRIGYQLFERSVIADHTGDSGTADIAGTAIVHSKHQDRSAGIAASAENPEDIAGNKRRPQSRGFYRKDILYRQMMNRSGGREIRQSESRTDNSKDMECSGFWFLQSDHQIQGSSAPMIRLQDGRVCYVKIQFWRSVWCIQ